MFDEESTPKIVPFPRRRLSPKVTIEMARNIRWLYAHGMMQHDKDAFGCAPDLSITAPSLTAMASASALRIWHLANVSLQRIKLLLRKRTEYISGFIISLKKIDNR